MEQLESSFNQILFNDEILVINNSSPSIALNDWFYEFLFLTDFYYFLNYGFVLESSSQPFEKLLNSEIPFHPTLRGTFNSSKCDSSSETTVVVYDNDCLLNCFSFDFWILEVAIDNKKKEITFNSQKNHHVKDQKNKLKLTLSMRKNCDKIRIFRNEIICSYSKMTDVMFRQVQKKILFDVPNKLNEEITAMDDYSSTIFQKEYLTLFVNSSPPVHLKRDATLLCEFVSKFETIVDKQKILNTRTGVKRIFVEDGSSKKTSSRKKPSLLLSSTTEVVSIEEVESSSFIVKDDEKKRQEKTPPSSSSKKNISDNNNIKISQFLLEEISSESDNNSNNIPSSSSLCLTTLHHKDIVYHEDLISSSVIIAMPGKKSVEVILNLNWNNGYISNSANILQRFNEDFRNSVFRDLNQATISIKKRDHIQTYPILRLKEWLNTNDK
jgi:hypothetical protein